MKNTTIKETKQESRVGFFVKLPRSTIADINRFAASMGKDTPQWRAIVTRFKSKN